MAAGDNGIKVEIDLVELITKAAIGKVLDTLSEGEQRTVFTEALVEYIKKETKLVHYDVQRAIQDQVTVLAIERLQEPSVQSAMRETAYEAVDRVIQAFAHEAAGALSRGLQATYSNIVEKYEKSQA